MSNKQKVTKFFDSIADKRSYWFERNRLYHEQILQVCRPYMNPDIRVLELGCNVGNLLAALEPAYGVGIDLSPASIEKARSKYPHLHWLCGDVEALPAILSAEEPFDIIIVEDLVGYLSDIQQFLLDIKPLMHERTRLIISTWNWLWNPALKLAEQLGLKTPDWDIRQNWISASALQEFLTLADYDVLEIKPGLLVPYQIPVITPSVNGLSYAPLMRKITLLTTLITRPILQPAPEQQYSVSVIIPTRNEAGNIATLVERTPDMGSHTELIFVDGNSTDGTVEEIHREIERHPERDIKFMPQIAPHSDNDTPPDLMLKLGKGDAVRKGFDAATGDILMILDSDVSVPPEELQRFYDVLATNKANFANGTRFVYNQESGAMKPLNRLGNVFFSYAFSWLLGQRVTDTLCGTKVLFKKDYEAIKANRDYFGDFDPFGDFDLLFGAAWLGFRIQDVPIHYLTRTYGASKVRVGLHGPLLGKMSLVALWHFKIRPLLGQKPSRQQLKPVAQNRLKLPIVAGIVLAIVAFFFFVIRRPRH